MKNKYFTERERYELELLLKEKYTRKEIAQKLCKCPKTIYNEIKRGTLKLMNSDLTCRDEYCADYAQKQAEYNSTAKGTDLKIKNDYEFVKSIEYWILEKRYSPYAALTRTKQAGIKTDICLKTLYTYIEMGIFPNITKSNLPYKKRKHKKHKVQRICARNIDKPSIEKRPEEIKDRTDFGHWEMDTVYSGKGKSKKCLLVLTERKHRKEIIIKMKDKTASSTVKALDKLYKTYGKEKFKEFFQTITVDNGVEFSDYENMIKYDRTKIYYCHPFASCERGSNENQNKLIRRWIEKGESIAKFTLEEIRQIQEWINSYPRKMFDGKSSNEMCTENGIDF